jgi:hypothetical protein
MIQERRLRSAGFTDAEYDDLGKEDLGILIKVIYQTPPLPVMDPVSVLQTRPRRR